MRIEGVVGHLGQATADLTSFATAEAAVEKQRGVSEIDSWQNLGSLVRAHVMK